MNSKTIEKEAPKFVKKWVEIALHQPTRDEKTVTKNMQWLYKECGLEPVPVQIVHSLDEWIRINKEVQMQTERNVGLEIEEKIKEEIGMTVDSKMQSQIDRHVGSEVDMEILTSVWKEVSWNVSWESWLPVEEKIIRHVNRKLREKIASKHDRKKIRSQIKRQMSSQVNTQIARVVHHLAFGDFFFSKNLLTKNKKTFYRYADVLKDGWMTIFLKDKCFVLAKPTVHLNKNGELHRARGRALDWGKDGLRFVDGKKI